MSVDNTPTPRTRALAYELRQVREQSGLSIRALAAKMDAPASSVGAWVSGRRVPNVEQVSALLAHCGVTSAERERIMDISRRASEGNWLTAGIPGVSQQLAGVLECESAASRIVEWSPLMIPGLLQTGDYARAVLVGEGDVAVRVRIGRRDILTRRSGAEFLALIGECAIRNVIDSPAVMVDQLRELLMFAERPNVTVQIVPVQVGWHPGLQGPFVLYEFPDQPIVAHLEHYRSGAFVSNTDASGYRDAATSVTEVAMSPTDSEGLIAEVIKEMEKQ